MTRGKVFDTIGQEQFGIVTIVLIIKSSDVVMMKIITLHIVIGLSKIKKVARNTPSYS